MSDNPTAATNKVTSGKHPLISRLKSVRAQDTTSKGPAKVGNTDDFEVSAPERERERERDTGTPDGINKVFHVEHTSSGHSSQEPGVFHVEHSAHFRANVPRGTFLWKGGSPASVTH